MTDQATAQAGTGDAGAAPAAGADVKDPAAGAPAADAGAAAAVATATDGAAAKPAATTIAEGGAGDGAPAADGAAKPVGDAGADWRAPMAGDNKKFLERLQRFASPAEFAKSYQALEQKLSSGEFKKGKPENATPEQIAAWRKENGLPESWEGYGEPKLPNGIVVAEQDKPTIALFDKFLHENDYSSDQRNKLLGHYYEVQDAIASMRADADEVHKTKSEDTLRAEWGADYRRNLNSVVSLASRMPEDLYHGLFAGRMADGTRIGDHPGVLKWLAQLSLDLDPAATLVPAGGGDSFKGAESRLEEIRKFARENPDAYDSDHKMQAEQIQLIEAIGKIKARGRAA